MNLLIRILINALVAFGLAYLLDGVYIKNFTTALWLAVVLGLLNALVKPFLILLTLPISIVTLGLFLLVINAGIILLGDDLIDGFRVDGFWTALLFSILLSIFSSILYSLGKKSES
jgi:putative membrane protein